MIKVWQNEKNIAMLYDDVVIYREVCNWKRATVIFI